MTGSPRTELAAFLRSRRRQVEPASVGLPGHGARRAPGLRREEVALLSGVSHTWYTWLEQGRDISPSRQVVDAVARTLQLSPAEHEYVLRLTGHAATAPAEPGPAELPAHAVRLLDALGPSPAFVLTHSWSILGWNAAYERLYPGVATAPEGERNLLWVVFTDPAVRSLLGDWATDSRRFLTQFRAEVGSRVHDPAVVDLVTRLQAASEHFRAGWASHDVDSFSSSERRFEHSRVGSLLLEHHQLTLADSPDLHLVVYTAAAGTDSAARLARLSSD
ncbi:MULTISPECIES: helix-turn-helix transcriptional regulator [unclassified Modestobacter]|uniref:helix-turn-helix transcriptional regulator n=1 Tax=unclassified Modestobacter TaxID=2643866 RepID=UPI0022A9F9BA|nr:MULTISPECIES: helix-turn-helix transcriptional regulator [unclassified Modestobacter]MCZ2812575.1 helix-turn-helix transcriptional regulator [Modestobacter sp. VKM Ac-2979]MCZ2841465.1 helix-turn-helix transcriptional regulator [Modestobacter sp. VKM Ac-2980]MCZ2850818.1 helix-turn-helix transcriptional regulator [Modestobacter sp. VKM Ac-2978]